MRKENYKEKGITLVALVVTIIILLILAGVTLTTALSQNGLFQRAKYAVEKYKESEADESEKLGEVEKEIDKITDGKDSYETPVEGNTTTPPPAVKEIGSDEIAENLKGYQGKYVDIGLDTNGNKEVDDWEIFYATKDRIFLIASDYVPVTKLTEWGILDENAGNNNGFVECDADYCASWKNEPSKFVTLPEKPANFLSLVMHTGYNLSNNNNTSNSQAVSYLLNTTAWKGIKEAATENASIDFVIGGPTLEMWCAAWNKAVVEDANGFVKITPSPQTSSYGYYVSSASEQNQSYLYMNGTTSSLASDKLTALETNYKTFFPHAGTSGWKDCYGYWLASPSASEDDYLMFVYCAGNVSVYYVGGSAIGVRPVVSLNSGVQIVETVEGSGKYKIAE